MSDNKKRALEFEAVDSEPTVKRNNYLLAIGIDKYLHCAVLNNAVSDAKAFVKLMTERFQFEEKFVHTIFDEKATLKNMIKVFREIAKKITSQDNLLVYFSGHGHYDDFFDEGHWIPVDAKFQEEDEYLSYNKIMTIIRAIKSHHTFMIVDSCYSGAVFVGTDKGSMSERLEKDPSRWLFASGRNEVVADGSVGENSPFAEQLLSALERYAGEGINASSLIDKVVTATSYNSSQTPIGRPLQDVGDQGGEFIFRPKMDEIYDWKKASVSGEEEDYKFFIKAYPIGKYAELASWKLAMLLNTVAAYDDYLAQYPTGKFKSPAMDKQVIAEEDAFWSMCEKANSISDYRKYILSYPQGRFVHKAELALNRMKRMAEEDQLAWDQAAAKHNSTAYIDYLKNFPNGVHARLAQEELDYLEERDRKVREKRRKKETEARREKEEKKRQEEETPKKRFNKSGEKRWEEIQNDLKNKPRLFSTNPNKPNPPKKEEEKPKPKPPAEGNLWNNLLTGFLSGLSQETQSQQNTGNPPLASFNLAGNWRGSDGFVYQLTQQGNIVYCRGVNNFGQIIAEGQGNLNGNQLNLSVRNLNGTNSTAHLTVAPNGRQMQGTVINQFHGRIAMSLWR